jgi:hypothetical protein
MSRLTLIMTVAIVTGCSTTGWRAQKIDGSSLATLEKSVVSLQQRLSSRRRADLEAALAVIWLKNAAVGAGDLDSDGRVDLNEVRALQAVRRCSDRSQARRFLRLDPRGRRHRGRIRKATQWLGLRRHHPSG